MRKRFLSIAVVLSVVSLAATPVLAAAPVQPTPTPASVAAAPLQPWVSWEQVQAGWRQAAAAELPPRVKVRAVYMSGYMAGYNPGAYIDLVKRTELNAIVVDIKADTGHVTYDSQLALPNAIGAVDTRTFMSSLDKLVTDFKAAGVYSIGRIVTFKDPILARARPDRAAQRAGGGVWRDYNGVAWLNPYDRRNWEYAVNVAKEAARHGVNEIQFDYVRFPSDGDTSTLVFPGADSRSKAAVIAGFLAYARKELAPYHVWVSADVFGYVVSRTDDLGIGQHFEDLGPVLDYISPMVYPSHYGAGGLGVADPDGQPYDTVLHAMQDAKRRLAAAGWTNLTVRPWLQDFSLYHHYPPEWVRAQIQAVYDAGFDEWLLWNAANIYSESALKKK